MQTCCLRGRLLPAGLLALAVASIPSHNSRAGAPEPVRSVNASELLKEVQIIGTLGKPLGELVTIRGTWERRNEKDASAAFIIKSIDGKRPESKLEFKDHAVRPFWKTGRPFKNDGDAWDWKTTSDGREEPPKPRPGDEWELMNAETCMLRTRYSKEFYNEVGPVWFGRAPDGYIPQFDFIAMRRVTDEVQKTSTGRKTLNLSQLPSALPKRAQPRRTDSVRGNASTLVTVEDIGERVALIGRLGKPLGEMMEMNATWRLPGGIQKDSSIRLDVTEIDGRKLAAPIEFNVAQIKAVTQSGEPAIPSYGPPRDRLDGVTWTLEGFETGRHYQVPDEYWHELGSGARARAYWAEPFTSILRVVVQPTEQRPAVCQRTN